MTQSVPPTNSNTKATETKHEVALWAGIASFFGSLMAIGVFDLLNPDKWVEYIGSLLVAFITAGAVYAKERLADAKAERKEPPNVH
jgi:hypothetical protein